MSFDWVTFGFQLVNLAVLIALLRQVLFRPVAAMIARRQAETEAALAQAAEARKAAEAAAEAASRESAATVAARHEVLLQAQAEAEAARAALLEQARAEAAQIVTEGSTALAREATAHQAQDLGRARDLAAQIAARLIATQPEGIEGYARRLAAALSDLPPLERAALLAAPGLQLVAHRALSAAELAAVQALLAPFGIAPPISTDPALIAGLELRSDTGALHNALAHDLDRICKAMADDR